MLRHPDCSLFIAGEGPNEQTGIEEQEFYLATSVRFIGFFLDNTGEACMGVECDFPHDTPLQRDVFFLYYKGYVPSLTLLPVQVDTNLDVGVRWHISDTGNQEEEFMFPPFDPFAEE